MSRRKKRLILWKGESLNRYVAYYLWFIWLFIAVLRRVKCRHRLWSFYLQRKKTWVHPRAMHSGESSHLSPTWTAFWHPGMDASCGSSLLLVLSFALRFLSLGTPFSPLGKINISKFQFDQESAGQRATKRMFLPLCFYLLFIINFLWDVSFMKGVLLNKFLPSVLYVFFSCYSKWLNLLFLFIAIKQEKRKLL